MTFPAELRPKIPHMISSVHISILSVTAMYCRNTVRPLQSESGVCVGFSPSEYCRPITQIVHVWVHVPGSIHDVTQTLHVHIRILCADVTHSKFSFKNSSSKRRQFTSPILLALRQKRLLETSGVRPYTWPSSVNAFYPPHEIPNEGIILISGLEWLDRNLTQSATQP
jgi:hypothetical protein